MSKFKKLYNRKEVAEILGVSERTILKYIYENKIKCCKISGVWAFSKEAIEDYRKGKFYCEQ